MGTAAFISSQRTLKQNPLSVQIARVNGHNMSTFQKYFGITREIASLTKELRSVSFNLRRT